MIRDWASHTFLSFDSSTNTSKRQSPFVLKDVSRDGGSQALFKIMPGSKARNEGWLGWVIFFSRCRISHLVHVQAIPYLSVTKSNFCL
jgi:hypothetical protein